MRSAFEALAPYLDGKDAAICACVCKSWNVAVESVDLLKWKKKVHLIRVRDGLELRCAVSKAPLKKLSDHAAVSWLQNIFWYNYQQNYNLLVERNMEEFWDRFLNSVFHWQTDNPAAFYDATNDLLVFANDYYAFYDTCCYAAGDTYYLQCSQADHVQQQVEMVNNFFPGLVVNWKLIKYPYPRHADNYDLYGHPIHRMGYTCIYISTGGILKALSIRKNLERMQKAAPKPLGFMKRLLDEPSPVDRSVSTRLKEGCVERHIGSAVLMDPTKKYYRFRTEERK